MNGIDLPSLILMIAELKDRIAELEHENEVMHKAHDNAWGEIENLEARIAELEVPLCIGKRTIGIMAEEGMWQSEDGRAVVAADELFRQDPYARIAELEAALKPFAEMVVKPFDDLGGISKITVGDLRAARAAYLGEKKCRS